MSSSVTQRKAEDPTLSSWSKDKHTSEDTTIERDIDGLPLRDQKKIDLKLILGHTPDVEDDDDEPTSGEVSKEHEAGYASLPGLVDDADEYEYGYSDDEGGNEAGDDDDDEERRTHVTLQRRSSLKMIHSPEICNISSVSKKAVRFADALGICLADVKDLINADEPPEIPNSALKDLRIRKKRSKLSGEFHLTLSFDQPSSDPEFMVRLQQQKVMLENCVASDRDLAVSGVIRVANVSFEKRVVVRYTLNYWKTFKEASTTYVPNSNDGATDRFMFILHLPAGFGHTSEGSNHLEFAIQYFAGEEIYWDSNKGSNYVVDCTLVPVGNSPLAPQNVSMESSGSEGEFII